MSHQAQRLASLSAAFASRQQQAEELWIELKDDILNQPDAMRRYCACLRLCDWLKSEIQKIA